MDSTTAICARRHVARGPRIDPYRHPDGDVEIIEQRTRSGGRFLSHCVHGTDHKAESTRVRSWKALVARRMPVLVRGQARLIAFSLDIEPRWMRGGHLPAAEEDRDENADDGSM